MLQKCARPVLAPIRFVGISKVDPIVALPLPSLSKLTMLRLLSASVVSCLLCAVAGDESQSGNLRGNHREESASGEVDNRDYEQCGILGGPLRLG